MQDVEQRTPVDPAPTPRHAGLGGPALGYDTSRLKLLDDLVDRAELKVAPENPAHRFGLSLIDREGAAGGVVAQRQVSPHPHAQLLGRRDLPPQKWTGLSRSAFGLGGADIAQ